MQINIHPVGSVYLKQRMFLKMKETHSTDGVFTRDVQTLAYIYIEPRTVVSIPSPGELLLAPTCIQ